MNYLKYVNSGWIQRMDLLIHLNVLLHNNKFFPPKEVLIIIEK